MINPLSGEIYKQRKYPVSQDIRGEFFRDQTKIIHSLPFRRLKHKTQVFFSPSNDHICTRIEHVLHVATISATICRGLNTSGKDWSLEPDMAYAIGLGHDLGHAPFGHSGEKALEEIFNKLKISPPFMHELNSYRVVEYVANYGKGLNLTYGVRDGIICHNGEDFESAALKPAQKQNDFAQITNRNCLPSSYEGCIVRVSDKIGYLGRDIEDAIKAELITQNDIPADIKKELGTSNGEIINTLVQDVIDNSAGKDSIGFSDERRELVNKLKDFNYKHIYNHPKLAEYGRYVVKIINHLFGYYADIYKRYGKNYGEYAKDSEETVILFGQYVRQLKNLYEAEPTRPEIIVADYISGMTDQFAMDCIRKIFLPPHN